MTPSHTNSSAYHILALIAVSFGFRIFIYLNSKGDILLRKYKWSWMPLLSKYERNMDESFSLFKNLWIKFAQYLIIVLKEKGKKKKAFVILTKGATVSAWRAKHCKLVYGGRGLTGRTGRTKKKWTHCTITAEIQ